MESERQEYKEASPWWGEHIHRYNEACKLIRNKDKVLDIACGNGFGSHLITRQAGAAVIGGDISEEAVLFSGKNFQHPDLEYKVVDGTDIKYEDSFFDVVVSFETIEHTTEYDRMLGEFYRVLKPGGSLVLSTPNILVNSPGGVVTNPYHTQEFNYGQLEKLIVKRFSDYKIMAQKYNRYKSQFGIAQLMEWLFYRRGIRKIPVRLQESIMKILNGVGHYPVAQDYVLVSDKEDVLKCKTFFVVAKKNGN